MSRILSHPPFLYLSNPPACAVMHRVPKDTTWRTHFTCASPTGAASRAPDEPSGADRVLAVLSLSSGFSVLEPSWPPCGSCGLPRCTRCDTSSDMVRHSNMMDGRTGVLEKVVQVVWRRSCKRALKLVAMVEFKTKCRQCSPWLTSYQKSV